MAEGYNLHRGNWLFILEPHTSYAKELQAMAREHRFVQKEECWVLRYIMPSLPEEKLIADRAAAGAKVTTQTMKVRLGTNNVPEFIDDEDELSGKKKKKKAPQVIDLDEEDELDDGDAI